MDRWRLIGSKVVVSNRWLRVLDNHYEADGRSISEYFVVERSDFVLVVATNERDELLLVRQYRAATDAFYVALPAGYVGDTEDPESAARRELREETGTEGRNWRRLGALDPLPGYIRSRAHVFACDVAGPEPRSHERQADEDETVENLLVHRDAVRAMIADGAITEMQAVAAILLADAVEPSRPE